MKALVLKFACPLRSLMLTAALAIASLDMAGTTLQASDCYPTYRYEWVQRVECRQVPYTVCVTRYDHCGRAYQAEVVRYRTEHVSVWHQIRVRVY